MVRLKSVQDIKKIRLSGKILAETFAHLEPYLQPGISTGELDKMADEFIRSKGAVPAFYQYSGFPKHICTSVNHVVIHGIPDKKQILQEGDIIGVDIGVNLNGYFSDSARTYGIGKLAQIDYQLLKTTKQSLMHVIEQLPLPCKKGRIKDVGKIVTEFIRPHAMVLSIVFAGMGSALLCMKTLRYPTTIPPLV